MTQSISTLLRRALVVLGAASALVAGGHAAAQTITLSGSTSATCTWTNFSMQPNGAISVTCGGGTIPPVDDPNIATFTVAGPNSVSVGGSPVFTVTRTAGPASSVAFGYTVSGAGCGWVSDGPFFLAKNESKVLGVYPVAVGSCLIKLVVQDGHKMAPTSGEFTFQVNNGVNPPPPSADWSQPVPVITGCPTAPTSSRLRALAWGDVMRAPTITGQEYLNSSMASGQVMAIKIPQSPSGRPGVTLTQGQGTVAPPQPTMELSVSRCPGVMETNLSPLCYARSTFANYHAITAYNRLPPGKSQAEIFDGCFAPSDQEQYYVNIRWTFNSCPFGTGVCAFTLQWAEGS